MTTLDEEFAAILDGKAEHARMLDFLERSSAWMGNSLALAAGARALRERMVKVSAPAGAIDVCGTGGDGAQTLNISTAVTFVVAGCGIAVAKHGNRAMSSKSGAADVLEALGVRLTDSVSALERCLREAGVAFLFAQNHHPTLRNVAAARREYGRRTIFNLLGPLVNPAGVTRQLVGVFGQEFVEPMAYALRELGSERAWVVHGAGGLDELSASAGNTIARLVDGEITLSDDEEAGSLIDDDLHGGDAEENATNLRSLLGGGGRPGYRAAVLKNAQAALHIAGRAESLEECRELAEHAMDGGAARLALTKLIDITWSEE